MQSQGHLQADHRSALLAGGRVRGRRKVLVHQTLVHLGTLWHGVPLMHKHRDQGEELDRGVER